MNPAQSALRSLYTHVMVTVPAEPRPLPVFWYFGLVRAFLGGEWVCFRQPMTACRWGWEWINHKWMPIRAKKMRDVNVAAKKRNYSSSEAKWLLSADGEAGDEERCGVGLLSVGQVGTKHWRLACASLLNYWLSIRNKCNSTSIISTHFNTSCGVEPGRSGLIWMLCLQATQTMLCVGHFKHVKFGIGLQAVRALPLISVHLRPWTYQSALGRILNTHTHT